MSRILITLLGSFKYSFRVRAPCSLSLLNIMSVIASGFGFTYLLGFVIPVLIVVFLLNAQSKAWFKAKGGKTF